MKITIWKDGRIVEYVPNEKSDLCDVLKRLRIILSQLGVTVNKKEDEEDDG